MLVPLEPIVTRTGVPLRGVLHLGAHACEERAVYARCGVPPERVLWVDANPAVVARARAAYPDARVVAGAMWRDAGRIMTFHVTNNLQSSSLLPLAEHREVHPDVHETHTVRVATQTVDSLLAANGYHPAAFNALVMDIQGAELAALQGAAALLPFLDYVYTEVSTRELYAGCASKAQVDALLGAAGFVEVACTMTTAGWGDAVYVRAVHVAGAAAAAAGGAPYFAPPPHHALCKTAAPAAAKAAAAAAAAATARTAAPAAASGGGGGVWGASAAAAAAALASTAAAGGSSGSGSGGGGGSLPPGIPWLTEAHGFPSAEVLARRGVTRVVQVGEAGTAPAVLRACAAAAGCGGSVTQWLGVEVHGDGLHPRTAAALAGCAAALEEGAEPPTADDLAACLAEEAAEAVAAVYAPAAALLTTAADADALAAALTPFDCVYVMDSRAAPRWAAAAVAAGAALYIAV